MGAIKVVSRQSPLALLQVEEVFSIFPDLKYDLIKLDSFGDKNKQISLLTNPPADIFTRELDAAILNETANIAIHSAKDLPYPLPDGIELIALFEAFDQTDALISKNDFTLANLPIGARVGTSSPARKRELLALRPDVKIVSIRGTIQERIAQIDAGFIDALIVATCALKRLRLENRISELLPFETHSLQGNLAITAKINQPELKSLFTSKDIRTSYGKVTLVGFGPGNPDLLTLGGDYALRQADIIFHDDLLDVDFLQKYTAEKVYVGKRKDCHSFEQSAINRLLLNAARSGKQVVRLKGGDSMVFAHGGEEIEYLQSNFIQVDVIPGVSAGIAVSSLTKVPLTHRGVSSSVSFVTGHTAITKLPDTDTVVIYMGGASINQTAANAIINGRHPKTPVMLVYNVSQKNQTEYFSTLSELSNNKTSYPTPLIIVIGDVIKLRNNSEENVKKPFYLVTGTQREHYDQLGTVIHQPLIKIEAIWPNSTLEQEILQIKKYDWLFFTSRYTVKFFFDILAKTGNDSRHLSGLKIASVGKITSQELHLHGIIPDLQAQEESSVGLLKWIVSNKIPPASVLIPRSEIGLPLLPDGLSKLGWKVNAISAYRNTYPEDLKPLDLSQISNIVFSSPSCVTNFLKLYQCFPEDKNYIFRGKETEKRFNELNHKKNVLNNESTN